MGDDGTNRLLEAALEIQAFCERRHWQFCFIGGIAVQHWGAARVTRDADLTVFTGFGDEQAYIDALLHPMRWSCSRHSPPVPRTGSTSKGSS